MFVIKLSTPEVNINNIFKTAFDPEDLSFFWNAA
jgi:hypothetical protein